MLVEDNRINAMLATHVLTKKGFTLDHVVNGALSVEAVKNKFYDLILMDIQMPIMDGIQATIAIRKLGKKVSKIPIIALTAHSLKGEMQNCYGVGMNGYVSKPFNPNDLFNNIFHAMEEGYQQ